MKRLISIALSILCAAMLVFPAFAEENDISDLMQWARDKFEEFDSVTFEKSGEYTLGKQLEVVDNYEIKKYNSPKVLEDFYSRLLTDSEETRDAAYVFLEEEYGGRYDELLDVYRQTQVEQVDDPVFTVSKPIPTIDEEVLLAYKKHGITAADIRSAVDGFRFVIYASGIPFYSGALVYEPRDEYTELTFARHDVELGEDPYSIPFGTNSPETASGYDSLLKKGDNIYLVTNYYEGMPYYIVEGDTVTVAKTGSEELLDLREYTTARFLQQDEIRMQKRSSSLYLGGVRDFEKKTYEDFFPQARFILYVRPWIIAGSVVLGLAVIGAVVLVVWRKKKAVREKQEMAK